MIIIRNDVKEIINKQLKFTHTSGIYFCYCTCNEKVYVGQTKDLYIRKVKNHCPCLRHNKHTNSYLQNAWNKYGEDNFIWAVIEYCDIEDLLEKEKYWMTKLNSICPNGFNIVSINSYGNLNKPISEETKQKMKDSWTDERKQEQSHKSKKMWDNMSEEEYKARCQKFSNKWTEERKQKISKMTKERWKSYSKEQIDAFKQKLSERHLDMSGGNNPRAKKVLDISTGRIFDTIKEAAEYYDVHYSTLKMHLKRGTNINPPYSYIKLL